MPGQTPKTQIPTMLDADPMATVAKAIRDLATAIDGRIPKLSAGAVSLTFDASGNCAVNHGMAYTPTYCGATALGGTLVIGMVSANATNMTLNARLATTGAAYVGTASIRWMAL